MFTTTVTVPASIGVIGPAASLAGFQYGTALTVQLPSTAGPSDVVQFYGANIPDATRLSQLVPLNGIDIPAPGESAQQPSSSTSIAANYSHLYAVRVAGTSGALAAAIAGATEPASGGGSSGVASVGAGTSIAITGSAQNPVVNYSGVQPSTVVYQEGGVPGGGIFGTLAAALVVALMVQPFAPIVVVDGSLGQPTTTPIAYNLPSGLVLRSKTLESNNVLNIVEGTTWGVHDNLTLDGLVVNWENTSASPVQLGVGTSTNIVLRNFAALTADPAATQPFMHMTGNAFVSFQLLDGAFTLVVTGGGAAQVVNNAGTGACTWTLAGGFSFFDINTVTGTGRITIAIQDATSGDDTDGVGIYSRAQAGASSLTVNWAAGQYGTCTLGAGGVFAVTGVTISARSVIDVSPVTLVPGAGNATLGFYAASIVQSPTAGSFVATAWASGGGASVNDRSTVVWSILGT